MMQYVLFFCLASFTQHNYLEIYPCCLMCQYFIPFYCGKVFHCMDVTGFINSPLMVIWVVCSLRVLQIELLWRFIYKCYVYFLIEFFLTVYPRYKIFVRYVAFEYFHQITCLSIPLTGPIMALKFLNFEKVQHQFFFFLCGSSFWCLF